MITSVVLQITVVPKHNSLQKSEISIRASAAAVYNI